MRRGQAYQQFGTCRCVRGRSTWLCISGQPCRRAGMHAAVHGAKSDTTRRFYGDSAAHRGLERAESRAATAVA